MGDIAEMMLEGLLCEGCGAFIDDSPPGYPRYCSKECEPTISLQNALKRSLSTPRSRKAGRENRERSTKRVMCRHGCTKMFHTVPGMLQHALTVHPEKMDAIVADTMKLNIEAERKERS